MNPIATIKLEAALSSGTVPILEKEKILKNGSAINDRRKKRKGFRKAPQAPRRFKSPYILFSISKMSEYKTSGNTNVHVTSVSRLIAQEWKALSASEREKWNSIALQDKLRYNAEKSMYTGPWEVPSKRHRKDPSAPKRPPSAFLIYCQTERRRLKLKYPETKNTDISKLLGQMWKNAPPEIRQPRIDQEQRERELYKTKIAAWRQQRQRDQNYVRQQREAVAKEFVVNGYTARSSVLVPMENQNLILSTTSLATPKTFHSPYALQQLSTHVSSLSPTNPSEQKRSVTPPEDEIVPEEPRSLAEMLRDDKSVSDFDLSENFWSLLMDDEQETRWS